MNLLQGYIGTYTSYESEGIYYFQINMKEKKISTLKLAGKIDNPTYLYIEDKFLYSSYTEYIDEIFYGGVASFKINSDNSLLLISRKSKEGKGPCHISLNLNGTTLYSANYHTNEVINYNINKGKITNEISHIKHKYSNPIKPPQDKVHFHYSALSENENELFTIDLGMDTLSSNFIINNTISNNEESILQFKRGTGPRHMVFNKGNNLLYLISEQSAEVFVISTLNNKLEIINSHSLYKPDTCYSGAAIRLHPNKNFLYVSERKFNLIHFFDISNNDLKPIGNISSEGIEPRDFNISPCGKFLLCGNMISNNIALYEIDLNTGRLFLCDKIQVPSPISITFPN